MTPRMSFDRELEVLNESLINMGALVESAIKEVIASFKNKDIETAKRIITGDRKVDDLEKQIESKCLVLILRQQPVAKDLRKITTALKMITDMERIGDHAADIAELIIELSAKNIYDATEHIPQMTDVAISMVHDSITAYIKDDLNLARNVMLRDDIVDSLFSELKRELAEILKSAKDTGKNAIDYLMIAKYLERIADHAVNICEWIEFSQTGTHNSAKNL